MGAEKSGETTYWRFDTNEVTGDTHITVDAKITFIRGEDGFVIGSPKLVVAGGHVAVADALTVDDVFELVVEASDNPPRAAVEEGVLEPARTSSFVAVGGNTPQVA